MPAYRQAGAIRYSFISLNLNLDLNLYNYVEVSLR